MKTNLFLMMMLGSVLTANAQFNQGRMLVAGEFSFMSTTNKSKSGSSTTTNFNTTSVGFSPSVGYFFMDNLAAGAAISLSTSKTKNDSDQEFSSSSVSIGPFVRYYLPVGVFFQGFAGFGSGKLLFDNPPPATDNEFNTGVTTWDLGAGYAYFLNDYVALEPMIGYQSSTAKNKDTDDKTITSGLYINAALSIYLGERN